MRHEGLGSLRAASVGATAARYATIPVVAEFELAVDPACYTALPDDWVLGVADVVTSTEALEAGRYKAVNTAGAAVISAVSNALGTLDFPFVFTGDGASFAVGPEDAEVASEALAATIAWVGTELGLGLRGAVVPVRAIRAAGVDLKVVRYAASDHVDYAMFTGGGRDWAEREMKAGRLILPAAPAGARPDLSGLSCRFKNIPAAQGSILSVIVKPIRGASERAFAEAVADVLAMARQQPRAGHPLPAAGPELHWPPQGFDLEARLQRRAGKSLLLSRLMVAALTFWADLVLWNGIKIRGFSSETYRRQLVENSDIKKFDDGLMMTIDCAPETVDAIARRLDEAERAGSVVYGLHRQSTALVTCMVPSAMRSDHIHFVDGAAGGYAMAARDLKRKLPEPEA